MRTFHTLLAAAFAFAFGVAGTWLILRDANPGSTPSTPTSANERPVLYWYDPMVPNQHFDKPGKSPFMDMALVPKYADAARDDDGVVAIDPRLVQNLGIRTAVAQRGVLARKLRASGTIAFDLRAATVVSARTDGIVETLHVRAPLSAVKRGEVLLTLLAPAWTAAQEEYLALRRSPAPGMDDLREAARQRLRLLGMDATQIAAMERTGRAQTRIAVTAPQDSVVSDLAVREGASVTGGMPLLNLNGLDTVWVEAAIPEAQIGKLEKGAGASVSAPAFPGESFDGRIEALLPQIDAATRTRIARVVLDNPRHRLVPGMYVQVELSGVAGEPQLLLANEAVIATGTRTIVIVAEDAGRFRAQEIRRGAEAEGQTEVLAGLADGERVVLSGQFLIDSEASLSGALARLHGASDDAAAGPRSHEASSPNAHVATGTVRRIDGERWSIDTDAIASLAMGAMTMEFACPPTVPTAGVHAGQRVRFTFFRNGTGDFEITQIAAAREAPHDRKDGTP